MTSVGTADEQAKALLLSLRLNLALACTKEQRYQDAVAAASKVLEVDDTNVKVCVCARFVCVGVWVLCFSTGWPRRRRISFCMRERRGVFSASIDRANQLALPDENSWKIDRSLRVKKTQSCALQVGLELGLCKIASVGPDFPARPAPKTKPLKYMGGRK